MKIAKFGGTSVGSPEAIEALVGIVRERGYGVVVVSALSCVTDALIATAEAAAGRDPSWLGRYEAIGERHREMLSALGGGKPKAEGPGASVSTDAGERSRPSSSSSTRSCPGSRRSGSSRRGPSTS